MKTYADTVVNALHVLLTRSSPVFDYLTLIDGDDLLRLAHGGFIQTALLFENAVCRLAQLLQFRSKRHDDQRRSEEITAIVLNIDDRSNAALNIGSNPILTGQFTLPPPNGDRCVHPLMWLSITGLCLKNGM